MSTGGQPVGMDPDALGKMGNDFCGSAGVLRDQAKKVGENIIGASATGFAYVEAQGKDIENGLRAIETWLNDWAEATDLTGEAIGQDVVTYSNVDKENASQTQQAAS
ncbi:hypothetical protein [Nocardia carnea]|uniref:hypothetical protein n=1 Tax=Nocardia carnea TaxID=37328 RepID=UPI0024546402|nr:hypothetical protein [Nocardia carnea]